MGPGHFHLWTACRWNCGAGWVATNSSSIGFCCSKSSWLSSLLFWGQSLDWSWSLSSLSWLHNRCGSTFAKMARNRSSVSYQVCVGCHVPEAVQPSITDSFWARISKAWLWGPFSAYHPLWVNHRNHHEIYEFSASMPESLSRFKKYGRGQTPFEGSNPMQTFGILVTSWCFESLMMFFSLHESSFLWLRKA